SLRALTRPGPGEVRHSSPSGLPSTGSGISHRPGGTPGNPGTRGFRRTALGVRWFGFVAGSLSPAAFVGASALVALAVDPVGPPAKKEPCVLAERWPHSTARAG